MATFEKRCGKHGNPTWRVRVRRQDEPWLTQSFSSNVDCDPGLKAIRPAARTRLRDPALTMAVAGSVSRQVAHEPRTRPSHASIA